MLKLSRETKLDGKEVIQRAVAFFGASGLGLETAEQNDTSVTFEGGGGGVIVEVAPGEKGKLTVDLTSREWDFQIKQFLDKIK
jgi:hypothetical protein